MALTKHKANYINGGGKVVIENTKSYQMSEAKGKPVALRFVKTGAISTGYGPTEVAYVNCVVYEDGKWNDKGDDVMIFWRKIKSLVTSHPGEWIIGIPTKDDENATPNWYLAPIEDEHIVEELQEFLG